MASIQLLHLGAGDEHNQIWCSRWTQFKLHDSSQNFFLCRKHNLLFLPISLSLPPPQPSISSHLVQSAVFIGKHNKAAQINAMWCVGFLRRGLRSKQSDVCGSWRDITREVERCCVGQGQAGSDRPLMRCTDRPHRRKLDCCGASSPPLLLPILPSPPAGEQMEGPVGQKVKRERREYGHKFGEKKRGREKKATLTEMFASDKRCSLSTRAQGECWDPSCREQACVGSIWPRSLARVMQC